MPTLDITREVKMFRLLTFAVVSGFVFASGMHLFGQDEARVMVAELNGKPIYRDELTGNDDKAVSKALQGRIAGEIFERFAMENAKELKVTEEELEQATQYFSKKHSERMASETPALKEQLAEIAAKIATTPSDSSERKGLETKLANIELQLDRQPPSRETVKFILTQWKHQYVLYKKYHGGRLLWQQFGVEAFDATREMLETEEKKGRFKILDAKLRDEFYFYWTKQNHGAFLFDDPERIRKEFLEPEWRVGTAKP